MLVFTTVDTVMRFVKVKYITIIGAYVNAQVGMDNLQMEKIQSIKGYRDTWRLDSSVLALKFIINLVISPHQYRSVIPHRLLCVSNNKCELILQNECLIQISTKILHIPKQIVTEQLENLITSIISRGG